VARRSPIHCCAHCAGTQGRTPGRPVCSERIPRVQSLRKCFENASAFNYPTFGIDESGRNASLAHTAQRTPSPGPSFRVPPTCGMTWRAAEMLSTKGLTERLSDQVRKPARPLNQCCKSWTAIAQALHSAQSRRALRSFCEVAGPSERDRVSGRRASHACAWPFPSRRCE